jgi:hypothetical protein
MKIWYHESSICGGKPLYSRARVGQQPRVNWGTKAFTIEEELAILKRVVPLKEGEDDALFSFL